jgi:hypothetical protein
MIEFPCISNLESQDVFMSCPWEFSPRVPKFPAKKVYKAWLAQDSTQHLLYCPAIGTIPGLRVNRESNPIHSVIALVADYDYEALESDLENMLERAGVNAPEWVHTTPSGGTRLVWTLDRPVLVASGQILVKSLRMAAKSMGLKALLPGFDFEDAFLNPAIYYDVGREWIHVEGSRQLSASLVEGWMLKCSEAVKWAGEEIPLDAIKAEMERKHPGKWTGPFELGSRGLRFWDPIADNETAAIVRPTGMQCFTGPKGFVTWAEIFGRAFVEQFTTTRLSEIVDGVWYDGTHYWYASADGKWEPRAEKEMSRWLKVEQGLSADKEKNATFSEVENALHVIDQHRRVAGAAPFLYMPPGMIEFMNNRVINTARVKALKPAERICDWGEHFPWIATFLEEFFDPDDQLISFLAWLKRFYEGALEGAPVQGQAVFIAGPVGQGKTMLSNLIISGLVGGHMDATKFLLGGTEFNKNLFHSGLWTIDDATPGDSPSDHKKFSSMLKKITANTTFEYRAMFNDGTMVEWAGRVMITGNLDAESLRILPDLDISILDKIMLFKAASRDKEFPSKYELRDIVRKELPFFASYLCAFETPEELVGKSRYGIHSYHHGDLRLAAGESTDAAVLEEILHSFIEERIRNREPIPFEGSATNLMQQLLLDDVLKSMIGRNSIRWLGMQLGKLEAQGRGVTSSRPGGRKLYRIGLAPDKA